MPLDRIENSAHPCSRSTHTHPESAETASSVPVLARMGTSRRRPFSVP